MSQAHPAILTIAGSDSGGGAGIQADLKTISMLNGYGLSVITALTAQNTREVSGIHAPPADFAALQLSTVLDDFEIRAAKTGMLFSAEIIKAVADGLDSTYFPLVVDPVCVSQTGHELLREDAVKALREELLPLATLVTPNLPEAELLSGVDIRTPEDAVKAMNEILSWGPHAVLLKGGHAGEDLYPDEKGMVVDLFMENGSEPVAMPVPLVETESTHGTGCTLSAAIATGLGFGLPLQKAVEKAQAYLNRALRTAFPVGKGFGPPNHLYPLARGKRKK